MELHQLISLIAQTYRAPAVLRDELARMTGVEQVHPIRTVLEAGMRHVCRRFNRGCDIDRRLGSQLEKLLSILPQCAGPVGPA
ncbi:hypothetical protein SCB29_29355 [Paraburkholderia sp. SIMBA_055]